VTVALSDILTPPNKGEIVAGYEKQAAKVQAQYEKGLTTDAERRQEITRLGGERRGSGHGNLWRSGYDEGTRTTMNRPERRVMTIALDKGSRKREVLTTS